MKQYDSTEKKKWKPDSQMSPTETRTLWRAIFITTAALGVTAGVLVFHRASSLAEVLGYVAVVGFGAFALFSLITLPAKSVSEKSAPSTPRTRRGSYREEGGEWLSLVAQEFVWRGGHQEERDEETRPFSHIHSQFLPDFQTRSKFGDRKKQAERAKISSRIKNPPRLLSLTPIRSISHRKNAEQFNSISTVGNRVRSGAKAAPGIVILVSRMASWHKVFGITATICSPPVASAMLWMVKPPMPYTRP